MTFGPWEWVRITCYAIGMFCACYLAFRLLHRHDRPWAMFMAALAALFTWYMVDLTMLSVGASTRETRNFATPITVLAVGSLISLAMREWRLHRMEQQVRRSRATLNTVGNGVANANGS